MLCDTMEWSYGIYGYQSYTTVVWHVVMWDVTCGVLKYGIVLV